MSESDADAERGTTVSCPRCGTALASSMGGLCPRCLALGGFGPDAPETMPTEGGVPRPEALDAALPEIEIEDLIARGGMGAVYKGRQVGLDRQVAVKLLAPRDSGNPEFVERFRLEARTLARLSHPGIVAVYECGEVDDFVYLVMEYVEGTDLADLIASGKLGVERSLDLVIQICQALQYAHDQGVIHRDIKPANILVDAEGRARIADFGLAKLLGGENEGWLTTGGERFGTPLYMAPEQRTDTARIDHRADIYSLGVMFYEMLTGHLPSGTVLPPSRRARASISARLDSVVMKAMEPDPARRFQRVSEVGDKVVHIRSRRPLPLVVLVASLALALLAAGVIAMTSLFGSDDRDDRSGAPVPEPSPPPEPFRVVELRAEQQVAQTSPTRNDRAGHALALRGSVLLLGAPQGVNREAPGGPGYVAVMAADAKGSWKEAHRLVPEDAKVGDRFGHALALDEKSLIVSASGAEAEASAPDTGALYVYAAPVDSPPRSWRLQQKIHPPSGFERSAFGEEMALHKDVLVVAARWARGGGAACVFERQGPDGQWQNGAVLRPSDATPRNLFGAAVAVSEDLIAISAQRNDDPNFPDSGAVYLFERDSNSGPRWTQTARLDPAPMRAGLRAGLGLAFDGRDRLLVGVIGDKPDPEAGQQQGSVQIFERAATGGAWRPVAKMRPPGQPPHGSFGRRLLIAGDRLLVGSDTYSPRAGLRLGTAYLFARDRSAETGWRAVRQYLPSPNAGSEWGAFGYQLAASGSLITIGVPAAESRAGGAYIFASSKD